MIAEIKKHSSHYFALGLIIVLGLVAILTFRFDPLLKNLAVYSMAGLYVLWGVIHHRATDHLRAKVVLEYILVAVLGVLIINTLI